MWEMRLTPDQPPEDGEMVNVAIIADRKRTIRELHRFADQQAKLTDPQLAAAAEYIRDNDGRDCVADGDPEFIANAKRLASAWLEISGK